MKKALLLFAVALLGMSAMAKPVDPAAAQRVAANFWNAHRDNGVAAMTRPMTQVAIPFDGMYLFKAGDKGFVFVAADDCVQPILGYSFTSPAGENLNPEVKYWLGTYQQQIDWLRSNGIEGSDETAAMWLLYSTAPHGDPTPLTAVSPLLTTTWDQSPYYNNLCPYDATEGDRAVTGCVATATAQVMKFWNHPAQGSGSHSYVEDDYGTLSANFGATTYQWTSMPNALTSASSTTQVNAVATLMYHIGVAIEMDYSVSGSGAYTNNYGSPTLPCAQNALSQYFGYMTVNCYYRDDSGVTDAIWAGYINTELNASRPVIYAGQDTSGAHCFVCDGYNNSNMYHFNWGWGGWQDGYYSLSNLAPGSGGTGGNSTYTFNLSQRILTGIIPDSTYTPSNPFSPDPDCLITSFPYTENFDDTNTYGCLRLLDANNDGESWGLIDSFGTAYSRAAYIMYAEQADDYLILPGITTPGNYTITWKARIYHSSYPETYQVYAGSNMIFSETLSSTTLVNKTATFTVTAGDTVLPMFRYISDDMYAFFIDDITISQTSGPTPPPTPSNTCLITSFPYTETFDDTNTYSCLQLLDANNDGESWGVIDSFGTAYSRAAYIMYAEQADDYLILPGITTPGNYTVTWKARIYHSSYPETYQVLAGNTAIFNETLSSTSYVTRTATFTVTAGDTTNIKFRYISDDMYAFFIDDITITQGTQQYTITVQSANPTMGSVSGGGTYNAGASVTISATANSGYHFTQWNDANTNATRTITVTGNATYIASFAADVAPGTEDTISWCDTASYASSVGAGGALYWGISLTPTQLTGHNYLKSVMLYVAYAGTYTLNVYTGGTTAPGTLTHTQTAVFSANQLGWQEILLDNTFAINATQNLWITFYNSGVSYPAAACSYVGNTNSDWASVDGTSWDHLQNLASTLTYSWLIKAVTSQSAGPLPAPTVHIDGPTFTATGVAQTFTATASGSATVTWTLAGATPASATGNTVTATWNTPGTYNIIATATNTYGIGRDTLTINVINCGTISTFPYTMTFEGSDLSQMACWTVLDVDGDGFSWTTDVVDSVIGSASYINGEGALTPDNWLISPQMQFSTGSTYTLSWQTSALDASYYNEHYGIYVSTTGTATSNFTLVQDYTMTSPNVTTMTLDLSSYAGQTIYIAFRHWNVTDVYWMLLDNITVTQTAVPGQNYTITVQSANPTMGSVSGGGTFLAGSTTTISATANAGYHFTMWNDGNTNATRTITVTGNATYIANFEADAPTQYTITVLANNNNWGTVSGGGTYNEGATVTISATANSGYHFTQWSDGNTDATRTITVTGDATYIANFEANPVQQYTITVLANNDSWGHVTGGGTYNAGSTVTISAMAYNGYQFVQWNDGNTNASRTITVTGDATYIATFEATNGIDGIDSDSWSIYPNPASNVVTVSGVEQAMVTVTDMTGRTVATYNVADGNNTIDVSTLTSGAYFLRIASNGAATVRKLIIK